MDKGRSLSNTISTVARLKNKKQIANKQEQIAI